MQFLLFLASNVWFKCCNSEISGVSEYVDLHLRFRPFHILYFNDREALRMIFNIPGTPEFKRQFLLS